MAFTQVRFFFLFHHLSAILFDFPSMYGVRLISHLGAVLAFPSCCGGRSISRLNVVLVFPSCFSKSIN
jgi:hypothetical protein